MRVKLGYSNLEIHPWAECPSRTAYRSFNDEASALNFLLQFRDERSVIWDLRRLLEDGTPGESLHRTEPDVPQTDANSLYAGKPELDVLQEVAKRLYASKLRVTDRGIPVRAPVTKEAEPMPPPPPPALPPPKPPPPDEPTFPPNTDAAAVAAVNKKAAEDGTPFCEICQEKAAAQGGA